jgi:hypothetical protein
LTALLVPEPDLPQENPPADVQLLPKGEDLDLPQVEPLSIGNPKVQGEPVGKIHQILVFDHLTRDLGLEPIVAGGEVGSGIVDLIGFRFGVCSPGAEIAVPQRAQGLAQTLLPGIEVVVNE